MLRPFWYNPPFDPPWATCDWIRLHEGPGHSLGAGYSTRCTKNNARWFHLLVGEGQTVVPETTTYVPVQKEVENEIICFPRAAYGPTPFANQASGHHGWNPTDPIAPAFGRAPMMFEFTRHMMRSVDVADVPSKSLGEIVIFFSSSSSDRININFIPHAKAAEDNLKVLQAKVNQAVGHERLKVVVKHEILYKKTAVEQLKLASTACVYVTAAGGGAFTAQFLPRGASIVLYHHSAGEHMHKGRVDWKVFNSATWMRSTYLDYTDAGDIPKLSELITSEVLNCIAFMDSLDV